MEIEYVIYGSGLENDAAAEEVRADLLLVGVDTKVLTHPQMVQASAAQADPYVIAVIGGAVGAVTTVAATAFLDLGTSAVGMPDLVGPT